MKRTIIAEMPNKRIKLIEVNCHYEIGGLSVTESIERPFFSYATFYGITHNNTGTMLGGFVFTNKDLAMRACQKLAEIYEWKKCTSQKDIESLPKPVKTACYDTMLSMGAYKL